MPHGPPTQDVFLAVFGALDPEAFSAVFRSWDRVLTLAATAPSAPKVREALSAGTRPLRASYTGFWMLPSARTMRVTVRRILRKILATLRHFALNIVRQDADRKVGVANSRKRAGFDRNYLIKLLTGVSE